MKQRALIRRAPAPAPGRRDSQQVVDAIIDATLALGDPDATLAAIARRAGVGAASLHRYFPTKAAIYAELSRRLQRDYLAQLAAILADDTLEIPAAIRACCRLGVVVPGVSPKLRHELNLSLPLAWSADNAIAVFRTVVDEMTRWLERKLPAPPPRLREKVFAAFASGRGLIAMAQLMPEVLDEEALVDAMVRGALAQLELGYA